MKARATSTKISTGRINEAKAEDSGSAAFFEGTKQMIKTLLLLYNIPNQCSFISAEYAEGIIKCEEFEGYMPGMVRNGSKFNAYYQVW